MHQVLQHLMPARQWLFMLIAALLFCSAGFHNNFPLVYPDSGAYLFAGYLGEVPWDRPLAYGLFWVLASFRDFPFTAIFFQGLILAYLVLLHFRTFVQSRNWQYWFLAFVFFAILTTALSLTASRMMPDIFTPVLILGFSILLFAPALGIVDLAVVSGLIIFSISVHNGHVLIGGLMLGAATLLYLWHLWRKHASPLAWRRLWLGWGLLLGGLLFTCTLHWLYGGKFQMAKSSEVFLVRQLIEFGILEKYLDKYCPEKDYRLCTYKDSLNGNFIWESDGPFRKLGGWGENTEEYQAIIKDALRRPKYFKMATVGAAEYTLKQFFSFHIDDFHAQGQESPTSYAIQYFNPAQVHRYHLSNQNRNKLNLQALDNRQHLVVYSSLFLVLLCFLSPTLWSSIPSHLRRLVLFLFLSLWVNAFVCGSLSTVVTRYQFRIMWLLPMLAFFILLNPKTRETIIEKLMRIIRN